MRARDFLMIPGPTPVPDAVLEAAARHPIGHRTAEFSTALQECVASLKWLGETGNDVFLLTASGTGAMEAAIANTVNRGDRVASVVCGVFGERWARIAEAYGADVERLTVPAGQCASAEKLREKLASAGGTPFKAVTITHNETSTGVMNDLQALVAVVREQGALSIVDAVTSFGACPLPIDEWGVDLLVTGSQKALMLPPGLAFVFVGERAWTACEGASAPRFYFDFKRYKKSLDQSTTPFTPNVSLVMALEQSLSMFRAEGRQPVFDRHILMRNMLRDGLRDLGLELFVKDDWASPTITAILPPAYASVDAIRKGMRERFAIHVADGQEDLKGKIFRIGHMGYVFPRDILMTLASLQSVLSGLKG